MWDPAYSLKNAAKQAILLEEARLSRLTHSPAGFTLRVAFTKHSHLPRPPIPNSTWFTKESTAATA